jgi:hypothetical protein
MKLGGNENCVGLCEITLDERERERERERDACSVRLLAEAVFIKA